MKEKFSVVIRKYGLEKLSQWNHIEERGWKERGCGIVALAMAASYYGKLNGVDGAQMIDALIKKGVRVGCYKEGVGWLHDGLIRLAKEQFGLRGKRWDFSRFQNSQKIFDIFFRLLKKGPVIVSVRNHSDSTHLIVVHGYVNNKNSVEHLFIADPNIFVSPASRFITKDEFLNDWTRRFIFIHPV